MKKVLTSSTAAFILILLNVILVSALTLGTVYGTWSNPDDPTNVIYVTDGDESQIRWGDDTGYGKSGLGFTGNQSLPLDLSPDTEFEIGTLRHFNNPVYPPVEFTE